MINGRNNTIMRKAIAIPNQQKNNKVTEAFVENFKKVDNNKIQKLEQKKGLAVISTMSSGKSTLINAILGDDILPAENQACTGAIFQIENIPTIKYGKIEIIEEDGIRKYKRFSSKLMAELNKQTDIKKIILKKNFYNRNMRQNIILYDTPGVNNSVNKNHREITRKFLEDSKIENIVYLINATQIGVMDDKILLEDIYEFQKNKKDLKIIFVLNKVDQIDNELENMDQVLKNVEEYITEIGFEKVNLIPIAAYPAKIFRKAMNNILETRKEKSDFVKYFNQYEHYSNSKLKGKSTEVKKGEEIEVNGIKYSKRDIEKKVVATGLLTLERAMTAIENNNNKIEIFYNPSTYEIEILQNSLEIPSSSKTYSIIKKNNDKDLHIWYKDLVQAIYQDFNIKNFQLIFNGRIIKKSLKVTLEKAFATAENYTKIKNSRGEKKLAKRTGEIQHEKANLVGMNNSNEIEISYNPFTCEMKILRSSLGILPNSKTSSSIRKNSDKALHFWYKEFIRNVYQDFNSKNFRLIFHGRDEEFADIEDEVNFLNTQNFKIELVHNQRKKDTKNILEKLEVYMNKVITNAPEELRKELNSKNIKRDFEEAKNNEAYISVIATMSSGKSTLINAMLGEELLPSKNQACTATITSIKDNKTMENFKVKVENTDGMLIDDWQDATREFLKEVNDKGNEEGLNIFMEGNIPGISAREMKLILVDTPGPNNSQNSKHKEATYAFIKDNQKNPLILYVMNSTQHATTDDEKFLKEISEIIKEHGKQAEERFIFVLNKIDGFDTEEESIEALVENNEQYLKSLGIENPRVFPLSAEAAKLDRLKKKGHKLTRAQTASLNGFENTFLPSKEDDYLGIDTIKYASIPYSMKLELYEDAEIHPENALIDYSGMTAIEKYIGIYMDKYNKTQRVKVAIGTLKKIIDSSYNVLNLMHGKSKEELEGLRSEVCKLQNILKNQGKIEIKKVKENIENIKGDHEKFSLFYIKVESKFDDISDEFDRTDVSHSKAESIIKNAMDELTDLMTDLKTSAESIIRDQVSQKGQEMLTMIKEYFMNIGEESRLRPEVQVIVDDIFNLQIPNVEKLIDKYTYTVREVTGTEFSHYKDTSKWWNPFSWGDKKAVYKDVYEDKEYIDIQKAFSKYINPLKLEVRRNVIKSEEQLEKNIETIKKNTLNNIEYIERLIDTKINELNLKLENEKNIENKKNIQETSMKVITSYKEELDEILSI